MHLDPWRQYRLAGDEPPDRAAMPMHSAGRIQRKRLLAVIGKPPRPGRYLGPQDAVGGRQEGAHCRALGRVRDEAKAVEPPDMGALDAHNTFLVD